MKTSLPEWRISNSALFKIIISIAICYAVYKLYPFFILGAISILLACTLRPVIKWLGKWLPHWAASLVVTILVILFLAGIVGGVLPPLIDQFSAMAKRFPEFQATMQKNLPPSLSHAAEKFIHNPSIPTEKIALVGQGIVGAMSEFVLIVILALYLAADGSRVYVWLSAFFSAAQRKKISDTTAEASEIIVAYVAGQLVTSVLATLFAFIVLQSLKVPAALVLAVLAGVFDILPMLGFFLFAIPAVLFALTVSLKTAMIALALYLAYHFFENYFIVPKVYGNRLRLSDLVVLVSVLAGTYLAGIPGAILVLPLVAVYPAIERIWLQDIVGRGVIERHEKVEHSDS